MKGKIVVVLGGTGFIGRYLVKRLVEEDALVRVGIRYPDEGLFLRSMGTVGQVKLHYANVTDPESLHEIMVGADCAVNLVGILCEKGKQTFKAIHEIGARNAARAAALAGVRRYEHISALAASEVSASLYARSKAWGERRVLEEFPSANIVRPSLIFGPEDHFFNRFARMAVLSPILPCFGGGETKFQPVYVGDVATAIVNILNGMQEGKIYELGGPQVYSFRELIGVLNQVLHRKRWLMPIPNFIGYVMGAFGQLLPTPPLTIDQMRLMSEDSVVRSSAGGTFSDLGIDPCPLEPILRTYLRQYVKSG